MTPIPQVFKKNGYTFKLERRSAYACIYEQWHRRGRLVAYEVQVIRIRRERQLGGLTLPESERLASNEEWGTYGWTFSGPDALARAVARFDSLQAGTALAAQVELAAPISPGPMLDTPPDASAARVHESFLLCEPAGGLMP